MRWKFHAGLFLTTLSLLNLELLLTRIFSVTMWYHFAFMAISLAMFGVAGGAVLVGVRPPSDSTAALAKNGIRFSLTSALSLILILSFPSDPTVSLFFAAVTFLLTAIPFLFAGIVICVALTSFPRSTGSIYAADLAGSAAGCLLFVPLLKLLDAPSAVILNSAIAGFAALMFLNAGEQTSLSQKTRRTALVISLFCLALASVNSYTQWINVRYAKSGLRWGKGLYQKWNALSRIHVMNFNSTPFGWGLSSTYKPTHLVDQLYLNIDGAAGTVITKYDGDRNSIDYLGYDVTALPYYLRSGRSSLIIGVGGGRDILTAERFGQTKVVGVEINDGILDILRGRFGDYSGHLDRLPGVTFVHDEARSYVTRSNETFGIIQASLIDTWAATAAGSYVLSENGLYTTEAWETFLRHLDSDGILSVSRWYYEKQPAETLRLASLAREALMKIGERDPRQNILIVRKRDASETGQYSVATLLVCRRPFTKEELQQISAVSQRLDFVPVLTPEYAANNEFEAVVDPQRYSAFLESYPLNLTAPTDDSPFFFHMIRPRDGFRTVAQGTNQMNVQAVKLLLLLLGTVTLLGMAVLAIPLVLKTKIEHASLPGTMYFALIGFAFMLMEIGQLERFTIFLGHPTYGMTVVLFSILLSSSLGSMLAPRYGKHLWLSLPVFAAVISLTPGILSRYAASDTPVRILVSILILLPMGYFMGMYFPVGMDRTRQFLSQAPLAWYWAVNGACSVIASVLAVMVTMFSGVRSDLWLAMGIYLGALGVHAAPYLAARTTVPVRRSRLRSEA